MLLNIDTSIDTPIYLQIANSIILGIAKGSLTRGFQLPSVRSLASDLSINMHTVNKSYKYLADLGYVTLMPKKGAVIAKNMTRDIVAVKKDLELSIAKYLIHGLSEEEIYHEVKLILKLLKEGD